MNLRLQVQGLWNEKRRELEVAYPALRSLPKPAPQRRQLGTLPEPYRLVLGRDAHGVFSFDAALLSAHVDMVGGIGSGKSNAMRQLAWLNISSAPALKRATIIIDPHGSHPDGLHRATLRYIVEKEVYKKRPVYVVDANSDWCTGIKLLGTDAVPAVDADNGIEAFQRMRGDEEFGPTLRRALHGLLAALAELHWTLAEADLFLDPDDASGVRAWAINKLQDRYAKRALMRLDALARDPRLRGDYQIETIGTENRLAPLLSSPTMRAVVGSPMLDMRKDVLDAGAVLLVNTSGHNSASEVAGDLLGKLVIRSVLHAAKRRESDSLALVFADECARYVSQDWERALAELRKYRVSFISGHQTYAMLGKPDDPVRLAIERMPASKIAFRMNSMEEASKLAPEIMRLNLEEPVATMTKPAVIGHRKVRLHNQAATRSVAASQSHTTTHSEGTIITTGTQRSKTRSRSETLSESETDGENWSHTHSESESWGESDTQSDSDTYGASSGGSSGRSSDTSANSSSSLSYDRAGVSGWSSQPVGGTESQGSSSGSGTSRSEDWSESESHSSGSNHTESHSLSSSDSDTVGGSHAHTTGRAETTGEAETDGTSTSTGHSNGASRGVTNGSTIGQGNSIGWSEAFEPVMAELPMAVHSLENVKHKAAELLCTLPTGTCVVRSVRNGCLEGAVVQVPERRCPPVEQKQYEADLRVICGHSGKGLRTDAAQAALAAREQAILKKAAALETTREPESFRIPAPKRRKRS